jgi:hypothetical protein
MCWSLQHDLVDSEFVGQQDNPLCDVLGEIAEVPSREWLEFRVA